MSPRFVLLGRIGAFAVLVGILTRFARKLRHHWLPVEEQTAPEWPPIQPDAPDA